MPAMITDPTRARQLAKAIATDIQLYNDDRIAGVTDPGRKLLRQAVLLAARSGMGPPLRRLRGEVHCS
jgi:hypothetical protein